MENYIFGIEVESFLKKRKPTPLFPTLELAQEFCEKIGAKKETDFTFKSANCVYNIIRLKIFN
jgi:hypothetical protein